MAGDNASVLAELEQVAEKHGGLLRAADVVEYARNPKRVLHSKFEWDDGKAAQEYRLWQAEHVISAVVTILPHVKREARAFVSLLQDRQVPGGGYRTMVEVLQSKDLRAALLEEAHAEADRWMERYRELAELAPVFEAMERVFRKRAKREPVPA